MVKISLAPMGSVRRWSVRENTKFWCSWQNADRLQYGCLRTGHHFTDRVIGARDRRQYYSLLAIIEQEAIRVEDNIE